VALVGMQQHETQSGASKRFIAEFINIIDPKRSSRQRLERKGPPGHHLHCGDLRSCGRVGSSRLRDLLLVRYRLGNCLRDPTGPDGRELFMFSSRRELFMFLSIGSRSRPKEIQCYVRP
jgi:hypothetical protein